MVENGFFSNGPKGMEHRGRSLTEVKAGEGLDYGQAAFPCLDGFGGVWGAAVVLGMLCRAPWGAALSLSHAVWPQCLGSLLNFKP